MPKNTLLSKDRVSNTRLLELIMQLPATAFLSLYLKGRFPESKED